MLKLKKSDAYLKIQKQFKFVGVKPLAFTSLASNYVKGFENTVKEIYKLIDIIKEDVNNSKDAAQNIKILELLIDKLYSKYVGNAKFKNHVNIWNEWQKIEDKINDEIGIELVYAAPTVLGGPVSSAGEKSAAYLKFQKKFISSVGLNPTEYTSLLFKYVKKFEKEVNDIARTLDEISECEKNNIDASAATKNAKSLMDSLYVKYVKNQRFKNHIDIWNEFMKLEDRFNQLKINLVYAAPSVNS